MIFVAVFVFRSSRRIVERSEIEPSLSILSYLTSLLRIINHPPNSNISILFDILPSKLLLRIAFFSK